MAGITARKAARNRIVLQYPQMKSRILRYLIPAALAALVLTIPFRGSSQEQLDPLIVAKDTHRLMFENQIYDRASSWHGGNRIDSAPVHPQ
jgi:hypothetical protein